MEKLKIFAVYDSKSKSFSSYNIANDERVIKNSIISLFHQSKDNMLYNFAEDYSVYQLATIDENGVVVPDKVEVFTVSAMRKLVNGETHGSEKE